MKKITITDKSAGNYSSSCHRNLLNPVFRKGITSVLFALALVCFAWLPGCRKVDRYDNEKPPAAVSVQELNTVNSHGSGDKPVILFVPGYTGALGDHDYIVRKEDYYVYQKAFFRSHGRTVFDMNDEPGFNSDHAFIKCNATAIANKIRNLKNAGQRVTIISHSKGGQEVLHALIEAENESALFYNSGITTPLGELKNKDLWPTVAGWVSLTSNFFESKFRISGASNTGCVGNEPARYGDPIPRRNKCQDADNGAFMYSNFEIREFKFNDEPLIVTRQRYMNDHRTAINKLMQCVTTLCAYATYIPSISLLGNGDNNGGLLGRSNQWHRNNANNVKMDGANDGLVPARAARLPGARFIVHLADDGNTRFCGVDHLAPAILPTMPGMRFWTIETQIIRTNSFVERVEAATISPPTANAGQDQAVNCSNAQSNNVTLNGSGSSGAIENYKWFENGQLIASGVRPSVSLSQGVHAITLNVSNSCGSTDTDNVIITVNNVYAPGISFVIDPIVLWPPNNQMRLVARDVSAYGFCNESYTLLVTVSSNEQSPGNNEPDWQVIQTANGSYEVWVRAKRNGNGNGRIYTITATATGSSGHSVSETGTVTVPHDQGNL